MTSLLPRNATSIERAIETATRLTDESAALLPLYRPHDIPEPLLPWLAWAFDVPIWPDHPVTRRRLVAESWHLHRWRGTLWGLRTIADLVGSEVVGAITPPAKLFAAPALTRDERNAFVSRYPQLRLYRHRTVGTRVGLHCGDTLGRWQPVQSDALLRIQPRASLFRDGVDTELAVIERATERTDRTAIQATVTEVAIPGSAARLAFVGRHPRHLTVTEAARRFYRLQLSETYQDSSETLRRVTAAPSLSPIAVRPDAVAQTGQASGVHAGQFVARHLTRSTARDRLYQRLYLFDPDIAVIRRSATLHLDAGRLGMPAHHAELAVRIPGAASRQSAGRYCRGYLVATDKAGLTDCLESLRWMARASDRIAINTRIKRPVAAGESVIAGQTLAGDWISN